MVVKRAKEQLPREVDGQVLPVDATLSNPNGFEVDNLYLDMNGIIHPCCHPEDKEEPASEAEMMQAVYEYTDRIFNIVGFVSLLCMLTVHFRACHFYFYRLCRPLFYFRCAHGVSYISRSMVPHPEPK